METSTSFPQDRQSERLIPRSEVQKARTRRGSH